jgi:hypothetical protein
VNLPHICRFCFGNHCASPEIRDFCLYTDFKYTDFKDWITNYLKGENIMNKRYTTVALLGLGFLLLLVLLTQPLYAQSSGPGGTSGEVIEERPLELREDRSLRGTGPASAPELATGPVPEETPLDLSGEASLEASVPVTTLLSSAPILPDGSTPEPVEEPMPEEEPFRANVSPAATIADFRISGATLRPRTNDVDYNWASGGGCLLATAGNDFTVFNAPVNLPQGSNILALRMYYNDTSADYSVGWFSIYNLYGELVDEWAVTSEGNMGNGFNDTDTISHTIDYLSYSYVINWRPYDLGSDMQLCGFRIFYEPPPFSAVFLPMVLRS